MALAARPAAISGATASGTAPRRPDPLRPDGAAAAAIDDARPGPRIYNLFPTLAGPIDTWAVHLPRIAAMGFDWIHLNPVHAPGASGSLYAIKDPYALNPRLDDGSGRSADDLLRDFLDAAGQVGLKVMLDLVVNHTATDALLVGEHPDWYRRNRDGSLYSPRAVDEAASGGVTVWHDLAELDYDRPAAREGLIRYWADWVKHHVGLGAAGFRCDAAYQVHAGVWRALIEAARGMDPECRFFAETLGCTPEQVEALADAGFDYLFSSAKWWDMQADWFFDQYDRFRRIAPSVAFPESHDTPRLAADAGDLDPRLRTALLRQRYLLSAAVATGVMAPMGFEYGFVRPLHVVDTGPADWADEAARPRCDLTGFIAEANAMKAALPALNVEGPMRRVPGLPPGIAGLLRCDPGSGEQALLLANLDLERALGIDPGLVLAGTPGTAFTDVTPGWTPATLAPGRPLTLEPLELRIFRGSAAKAVAAPTPAESLALLHDLADRRIAVEEVWPQVDGGRFAAKRVVGDTLEVWADLYGDGHDRIGAALQLKPVGADDWQEAPMALFGEPNANDRWVGRLPLTHIGRHAYRIAAWRDLYATWRADFVKKRDAGRPVALELVEGRELLGAAVAAAEAAGNAMARSTLAAYLDLVRGIPEQDSGRLADALLRQTLAGDMSRFGPRTNLTLSQEFPLYVDRTAARFAGWYELFPRSMADDPHRHGTFDDVIAKLPYVRDMGFDVLYFPPIHPIGRKNRKGRNNSLIAEPGDPGSPYAIGAAEGGHDAIHPDLGTLEDFRRLVRAAADHGLEIALDFAIQCSPDHPWIAEHPEWFDWRPDGTIKYAENPPKKYEDIVNVHFYRDALPDLWFALRDVVLYWVEQGVKIFRVDNPHTKPLPFWEWLIREVQDRHPDTIFLSEAFTRPKMMQRLAKLGFTQSYTYFTWRRHKQEFIDYLTELTAGPAKDWYRPNFFVNTPDIDPPYLHGNDPASFKVRAVLAATLSSVWGLYSGFELCEGTPLPGKEEYLDSEKYALKRWNWNDPRNIRDLIGRLNRLRREHTALQHLTNLQFFNAVHDNVLYYGKRTPGRDEFILVAVNLEPRQTAWQVAFEAPTWEFGLRDDGVLAVEDLLTGGRFFWYGKWQQVTLDADTPAALWRVTRPRTEPSVAAHDGG